MAKPIKIRDPKLRALLATVRGKRKTVGRKKSSKKAPKSQVNFYADKARALEAELRRMRERAAAAPQAMRKLVRKAKKVGKRTATQALRVPSLPADHPFNRPRKAAKKRAKKSVKRKTQVFHVKRSKKVAKKSVKRKTQVFHVKRSKKVAKKSKRTAKRVR
jgi:hypothetical protein